MTGRRGSQFIEWSVLTAPPARAPIWFLHLVLLDTPQGAKRFYFRTSLQCDKAWKALTQAWYAPKITDLESKLKELDNKLISSRYVRTSKWKTIRADIESWGVGLPAIPSRGVLEDASHEVLEKVSALIQKPEACLEQARKRYVKSALAEYHELFEKVETKPLTDKQRLACVVDEDNNLILAGAGTGKTSTVIGRVAFLVQSKQAKPEEILLLAYGREAAEEMRERLEKKLGVKGITAATFHALGRCIVERVEKRPLEVSPMATDKAAKTHFINTVFEQNQRKPAYQQLLLRYFERWLHPVRNPFDFKTLGEYYRFLEDNGIRTLKREQVKGFGECDIANFLFMNDIQYQYESGYDTPLQSPDRGLYRPDFFLTEYNVYIEHFGIDRNGGTAPYIDREKYHADMVWKRRVHTEGKTRLIETYHYEKQDGTLLDVLRQRLEKFDVKFNPLPDEAVLETLREFGAVKKFSVILGDMLSLIRGANLSSDELRAVVEQAAHPHQIQAALHLLAPIRQAYEDQLHDSKNVDYDDMITKAWRYVKEDQFQSPWKYIIVDEFQDIAKSRAEMVLALKEKQQDVSLFCVGDDWQSIYRFTGSDISFTSEFEKRFGATQPNELDKTFRFNSKIGDVASKFVMRNPKQLVKDIKSHAVADCPMVSLVRASLGTKKEKKDAIDRITQRISEIAPAGSSVYFLARFKSELPDLEALTSQYPNLTFKNDSIHTSKGKEADFVVILGVVKGEYGLPSEKVSHPLIEALLPKAEAYPHAEERRLFYVALTRAKHRVYIVTDMRKCSPFVLELVKDRHPLTLEDLDGCEEQRLVSASTCPVCLEGNQVLKVNGKNEQSFLGCTNFPRCRHTEPCCPTCRGPLRPAQGAYRLCKKSGCKGWVAICPTSGGQMVYRESAKKWGCSHYQKGSANSCGYMIARIPAPRAT